MTPADRAAATSAIDRQPRPVLAYAARLFDTPCTIVMPANRTRQGRRGRALGAELVGVRGTSNIAHEHAENWPRNRRSLVSSGDETD